MGIVIHNPIPSNYTINVLCERFRTIEPHEDLRTIKYRVTLALPCLQSGRNPRVNRLAAAKHGKVRPVESGSRCKYGVKLVDDYIWVLFLRVKLDAPTEFERWATMIQNGEGRTIELAMFDNTKELVAGRTRGFCEQQGIRIVSLVLYSPSSNRVANQFVGVATSSTRTMPCNLNLLSRFWAEAVSMFVYRVPVEQAPNKGEQRGNNV